MTAFRFFVIILIFAGAATAWAILGGTIHYRTVDFGESLAQEVDARCGPSGLVQVTPHQTRGDGQTDPVKSEVTVAFDHNNRYMGLLWFSTYTVEFTGAYTCQASDKDAAAHFVFTLPAGAPAFENLTVLLDGQAHDVPSVKSGDRLSVPLPADDKAHVVTVSYRTQARNRWVYDLAHERQSASPSRGRGGGESPSDSGQAAMVKDFSLVATGNFTDIDYPSGCRGPTPKPAEVSDGRVKAEWRFQNRSTRERIGIEMPSRENAGPIAARMAYYAPVSLFFFFTVMFTMMVLKKVPLHPMHYLFVSAGFFAFHILMAYLVDKISIHYTFWICAAVSVLLVVSYMRLVVGGKFAVYYVGLAQMVYLIGFSYAFFWTGWTGLTIVIVAIITLFVLMQATGRLNWNEVFAAKSPPVRTAAPAAQAPPPAPPAKP
jgi:hypothetical protein